MSEVTQRLTKRFESERDKRLRLREAARAKLERVEQSQVGLRELMDQHEAAIAEMKERLHHQQERTHAAEHVLEISKQAVKRAGLLVEQQTDARRAMHSELLGVQRAHESLRSDLEMTQVKLHDLSESENKAQTTWRLKHMEKLDSRIRVRQSLDQDVVVADAEDDDPLVGARA